MFYPDAAFPFDLKNPAGKAKRSNSGLDGKQVILQGSLQWKKNHGAGLEMQLRKVGANVMVMTRLDATKSDSFMIGSSCQENVNAGKVPSIILFLEKKHFGAIDLTELELIF